MHRVYDGLPENKGAQKRLNPTEVFGFRVWGF